MFIDDVFEVNVPKSIESEKPKEKETPKKSKPTDTKQKEHIIFEKRVTRSMSKSGMLLLFLIIIYLKL